MGMNCSKGVAFFIDVWLYGQELLKNISLGMYLVGESEAV